MKVSQSKQIGLNDTVARMKSRITIIKSKQTISPSQIGLLDGDDWRSIQSMIEQYGPTPETLSKIEVSQRGKAIQTNVVDHATHMEATGLHRLNNRGAAEGDDKPAVKPVVINVHFIDSKKARPATAADRCPKSGQLGISIGHRVTYTTSEIC